MTWKIQVSLEAPEIVTSERTVTVEFHLYRPGVRIRPPMAPVYRSVKLGVGLPQVEALQKSVRTASEGYPVKLLDLSEGSEPKYWQIAPDVYSGTPNDDGQRWIATKLLDK